MTGRFALLVAAGFAIAVAGPGPRPDPGGTVAAAQEWSAAKKRRYHRAPAQVHYAPRYASPGYGRLGDPSLGPNGLPYRRPYDLGGCIIDEGYGRFTSCSNR